MTAGALLLYAAGESDADLLWATRFPTPDPYLFLQIGRRRMIVVGDLELGRARGQASVDRVIALSEIERKLVRVGRKEPGPADVAAFLLRGHGVREVEVPGRFPLQLADELRTRGFQVRPRPGPFWEGRRVKAPGEVRAIEKTQRAVEQAVEEALETLRRAKVRGRRIVHGGKTLTSEDLRRGINRALMERDCVATDTIVACGDQACDPHQVGTGPLHADRTIVLDVFPRSFETGYFADMSRTVVKGRAAPEVRKLYSAVKEAQELGISRVRSGADGKGIHREIQEFFKKLGYRTGPMDGRMEGYFHGTGHGVGLDIHEAPWITSRGTELPEGAVVTVEPGLYYPGVGGVRLEDMVLVGKSGCRNLTRFPKVLEL